MRQNAARFAVRRFALAKRRIINSSKAPVYSSHSVPGSAKDRVQDLTMMCQEN
jgi:hypothetical protein